MNPTNPPSIPIGIRKIAIENFRGLDSLELSFLDAFGNASDIAVLSGPNGCGKTTVLEACLFVAGYNHLLRGGQLLREGFLQLAIRVGTPGFHIVAEVQMNNESYILDTDKIGYHNKTKSLSYLDPMLIPCLYFSSWRTPQLVGSLPITVGKQAEQVEDTEVNRLRLVKQFFVNGKFHSFMRSGKNATKNGRSPYDESIDLLNDVWQTFYPGVSVRFTVEATSEDPNSGFDVFLVNPSGVNIPIDALSAGQLELFTLFGSLLRLKAFEGLLVIDEPELHLDPQWHALMLRALRRFLPKAQLIVATHSPRIYDSVLSFQRFFLIPDDDPRARDWKTPAEAANKP